MRRFLSRVRDRRRALSGRSPIHTALEQASPLAPGLACGVDVIGQPGVFGAGKGIVAHAELVNPPQKDLQKGSDGLLRLKNGSKAETDPNVTVTSGVLESSNVNAAQSLINMIELQRLYDFQVKSMNSSDQNEQTAEQMMSNAS